LPASKALADASKPRELLHGGRGWGGWSGERW
jgi:hypothetical protein